MARDFVMPQDVLLENEEALDQYGLRRKRFQQYLGDAKVLGAQITVYTNAAGEVTLVTGKHLPS